MKNIKAVPQNIFSSSHQTRLEFATYQYGFNTVLVIFFPVLLIGSLSFCLLSCLQVYFLNPFMRCCKFVNTIIQILRNQVWEQDLQNNTKLDSNSDALGGNPAPSTVQGNSDDPLLSPVLALHVIISFNRAYKKGR